MEQELIGHTWDEWTQGSEANSSVAGTHCSFFFFFFFREKQPLCRITLQLEGVPHWEQEVDEEDVSSCCCQKDPPCQQQYVPSPRHTQQHPQFCFLNTPTYAWLTAVIVEA